ncbi:hypothetical protein [Streptomyces syringium]|uniref:hypothetical protein n=1 Tax=Streptomyces syringium TaxID=76729 RepID=UPI0033D0B331
MKTKLISVALLASLTVGATSTAACAVDPREEYNVAKCHFDKSASGKEREKYCKKLVGKQLTAEDKECLKRAGMAAATALTLGRINNKKAKEITANATIGALGACFTAKIK